MPKFKKTVLVATSIAGLEGCMSTSPYQPKEVSAVTIDWLHEPKEKREIVKLNSKAEAKGVLERILVNECRQLYNLEKGEGFECWVYECTGGYSSCGGENGECSYVCTAHDWVKKWELDLNDIQFMYAQSWEMGLSEGTDIEIITTKSKKINIRFYNSNLGEKVADILYTFFLEGREGHGSLQHSLTKYTPAPTTDPPPPRLRLSELEKAFSGFAPSSYCQKIVFFGSSVICDKKEGGDRVFSWVLSNDEPCLGVTAEYAVDNIGNLSLNSAILRVEYTYGQEKIGKQKIKYDVSNREEDLKRFTDFVYRHYCHPPKSEQR